MAKLRKARPDTADPAPPAPSPSSSSGPPPPRGSTSSRRPPSLLTASASTRTSPVALRTSTYRAPSIGASKIEAHGELIEGDSASEVESRSWTQRSRSPTSSSIRSHPRTSSPPASPRSHRRIASTASTTDSLATPATSPEQPRRALGVPSSASSTLDAPPSATSALAKLRTRLDSDQIAREAQRLQDEHAHAAGGKMRKKLPREVALEVAAHEHLEHLEHEHAVLPAEHEAPPVVEADLVGEVAEEVELAGPQPRGTSGGEGVEQEGTSSDVAQSLGADAGAVDTAPAEQESSTEAVDAPRIEEALEGLSTAALAPSATRQGSLLFAPARFGLRLAGSALSLGVGTTRSVLLHVPVVSSVVHSVEGVLDGVSQRVVPRRLSLGGPVDARHPSASRQRASEGKNDAATRDTDALKAPVDRNVAPSPQHSSSTLSRIAAVPLAPVHLAYSAAKLSFTVSVASVLVARTVTGMACDRLRGRPVRSPCA
ncbi:hypothetical protein JCM3775_007159 [Rhodotorula graminis]